MGFLRGQYKIVKLLCEKTKGCCFDEKPRGKNAINFGSKLQLSIKNSNLKKINMRNKTKKCKYSKKLWSTILESYWKMQMSRQRI